MQVVLIFANKTPDDVLLRDKFDKLAKEDERFSVKFLLSRPGDEDTSSWASKGRVSADFISQHCPAPSDDHLLFVRPPLLVMPPGRWCPVR